MAKFPDPLWLWVGRYRHVGMHHGCIRATPPVGERGEIPPLLPTPAVFPLVKEGRALFGGRGVAVKLCNAENGRGSLETKVGLVPSHHAQQPTINQSGLPSRLTVDHAAHCGSERPLPSLRPRPATSHMPYTPMG